MTFRPVLIVAALGVTAIGALASEPQAMVESSPLSTRSEAASIARIARGQGVRPKVVRRYEHAVGWSWIIAVPRLQTVEQARVVAQRLAASTGLGYIVVGPSSSSSPDPDTVEADPARSPAQDLDAFLALARRRNSPADALQQVEKADALTFRYVRVLADGSRIAHTYARHDGRIYLRFGPEGGAADQTATFLIAEGQAWAARGDAPLTPTDFYRTRDTVQRFAPERVLQPSLTAGNRLSFSGSASTRQPGSDGVVQLVVSDDDGAVSSELWIDEGSGRVVRVVAPASELDIVHELQGESTGSLRLPAVQLTLRGSTVLDRIEQVDLRLGAPRELAWFLAPGAGPI